MQFLAAASLNVVLVVHFKMGVRGVLWGNLLSNTLSLPLAIFIARNGANALSSRGLREPLFRF